VQWLRIVDCDSWFVYAIRCTLYAVLFPRSEDLALAVAVFLYLCEGYV